jgi:MFS family permease
MVFLVGFFYFATVTTLSTELQSHLDDSVRGRVMALYMMSFGGTVPLGLLAAGPIATHTSVTAVLIAGAVVAGLLAVALRPARRELVAASQRLDARA